MALPPETQKGWDEVRGTASDLYVRLIKVRDNVGNGPFKKAVRSALEEIQKQIDTLEKLIKQG